MGNWLSSPANKSESKKRAREEATEDCVLHMVPPKKPKTVFTWKYPGVPSRSGHLDTTTMTIETEDSKRYQTVYDWRGDRMELLDQMVLDTLDFKEIRFHRVDRNCPDAYEYFYLEVGPHNQERCLWFRGGLKADK